MLIIKKPRIIKTLLHTIVILALCGNVQAKESERSRYYSQRGRSSSQETYTDSLDRESNVNGQAQKKKKHYFYYTLITVVVFSAVYYFLIRSDDKDNDDDDDDPNATLRERIEKLKKVTGKKIEEGNWFHKNIKEESGTGSLSEEDAMKSFCDNARITFNEELLECQFQPSLGETIEIVSANLKELLANQIGNKERDVKKRINVNRKGEVEITIGNLIEEIKAFLKEYDDAWEAYRKKAKPPRKKGPYGKLVDDPLKPLEQLNFFDNTNTISYANFIRDIQNENTLKQQVIRIWTARQNDTYATPEQKESSRKLFFYIFRKMRDMVKKHKSNVDANIEENGEHYDKDDYLGVVFALLERIAAVLRHCHGRTKRAVFDVLSKVGLPAKGYPELIFNEMYWALDEFKVYRLETALPYILRNKSKGEELSKNDLREAREVHGQNLIMQLLQESVAFPGQEIAVFDKDGMEHYSGASDYLKSRYISLEDKKKHVKDKYFDFLTPEWVIDTFADYIMSRKKAGDIALNANKADELYYSIVYDKKLEDLPNKNSEDVLDRKLTFLDDEDFKNIVWKISKPKLAYLLYKLKIFRMANDDDRKNVLAVSSLA